MIKLKKILKDGFSWKFIKIKNINVIYLNNTYPVASTVFTIVYSYIFEKYGRCVVKISRNAITYNADAYIQNSIWKALSFGSSFFFCKNKSAFENYEMKYYRNIWDHTLLYPKKMFYFFYKYHILKWKKMKEARDR